MENPHKNIPKMRKLKELKQKDQKLLRKNMKPE